MEFKMTKPCPKCPFRSDIDGYLREDRMWEIIDGLRSGATFTCHETTVSSDYDDGEMIDGPNAQHCAGALIFLEHLGEPNQMMRIGERLGFYDRTKLDMKAPVFDCEYTLAEHHANTNELEG